MANARDPVEIARELIRCKSVTPAEGGALTYLEKLLKSAGFEVERVKFSEPGTPDVENLFARLGKAGPNLAFAGHTDVVPTGDETSWKHPPFGGEVEGGMLYGRGAVDMKGAIACFAAAALDYVAKSKPRARFPSSSPATRKGLRSTARKSCSPGPRRAAKSSTIASSANLQAPRSSATPSRSAAAAAFRPRSPLSASRATSPIRSAPRTRSARSCACWPRCKTSLSTKARRISSPRIWKSPRSTSAIPRST